MTSNPTIALYRKHYSDIRFERAGFFKAIKENFNCSEVLYPGSFIHIAPSYYFPHVVYVDKDPIAKQFFADTSNLLQHINRNKTYKRSSYVQFIDQDYSLELPLREGQFDLLLSIFAGGISNPCKKYLKTGGILVTNNYQNNIREAAVDPEYEFVSVLRYRKKKYTLVEDAKKISLAAKERARKKKYIRQNSSGIEYTENEEYFIFRRCLV